MTRGDWPAVLGAWPAVPRVGLVLARGDGDAGCGAGTDRYAPSDARGVSLAAMVQRAGVPADERFEWWSRLAGASEWARRAPRRGDVAAAEERAQTEEAESAILAAFGSRDSAATRGVEEALERVGLGGLLQRMRRGGPHDGEVDARAEQRRALLARKRAELKSFRRPKRRRKDGESPHAFFVRLALAPEAEAPCTETIVRDLDRTFPGDESFAPPPEEPAGLAQRLLLRVLRAHSVRDPSLGYCQGMNWIAGVLVREAVRAEAVRAEARRRRSAPAPARGPEAGADVGPAEGAPADGPGPSAAVSAPAGRAGRPGARHALRASRLADALGFRSGLAPARVPPRNDVRRDDACASSGAGKLPPAAAANGSEADEAELRRRKEDCEWRMSSEIFWVMHTMLEHPAYALRRLFVRGMPGMEDLFGALDLLMRRRLPKLHAHIDIERARARVPIVPACRLFAAQWFLSLFCRDFVPAVGLRVWDAFLVKGAAALLESAMAVLWIAREHLFRLDFEALLQFLQRDLPQRLDSEARLETAVDRFYMTESDCADLIDEAKALAQDSA
jgi:hypothetical protein